MVLLRTGPARAGNGTRTRDPNLGKVVLYQLSYSRTYYRGCTARPATGSPRLTAGDGGEGNRTPDLLNAIQALSQLSYAPMKRAFTAADQEPRIVFRGIGEVKKSTLADSRSDRILQRLFTASPSA